MAPAQHEELRPQAEQQRALRARVVVGQQRQAALERGQRRLGGTEAPAHVGEVLEQIGGAVGLGGLVDLRERRLVERLGPRPVVVRGGGPAQQRGVVDPGQRLGVGHARPQLQRALVEARGLAVGVHLLGRVARAHGGGEPRRLVAGGQVVVGDARREPGVAALLLHAVLERARERQVQLGVLAGQQVVVDDLAQQRVAEGVVALVVDLDHVAGRRLAQGLAQRGRTPGRRPRPAACDRGCARRRGRAAAPGRPGAGPRCGPSAHRAASGEARRARRGRRPGAPR